LFRVLHVLAYSQAADRHRHKNICENEHLLYKYNAIQVKKITKVLVFLQFQWVLCLLTNTVLKCVFNYTLWWHIKIVWHFGVLVVLLFKYLTMACPLDVCKQEYENSVGDSKGWKDFCWFLLWYSWPAQVLWFFTA
jgi:hypothetical protein